MTDEGKFVADFIASNLEKILSLGKQAYGTLDEIASIKLKTAYSKYLTATKDRYSNSKSFFIRDRSVDLYTYYVPTGIVCDNKRILKPTFKECVDYKNRIVITGTGGCGKSVLTKHLFLDCLRGTEYAPVLIELRELNTENQTLDELITQTLSNYKFDVSGDYIKRAKQAGHFAFFLDGFDEVSYPLRSKLINQIKNLSSN